jgi:phospholipase/lecithinase/hemolysin
MSSSDSAEQPTLVVLGDSLSDNGNLFKLIGLPTPPYWEGRSSNGPTYAEQLAQMLGMQLADYAYAGARASDASPTQFINPLTGDPLPIDLSDQLASYLASLGGQPAPSNATVLLNIGSNDYDFYVTQTPTITQAGVQTEIQNVVSSIDDALAQLTAAGVGNIILYTLPDFALSPNAVAEGPTAQALVHQIDVANNAELKQLASGYSNVRVVDIFALTEAFAADPQGFGLTASLSTELMNVQASATPAFAPNEVAFYDGEHPTYAAHGVIAAFSDATLTSDRVTFLDGSQTLVNGHVGSDFIFATPLDPATPDLSDDYTMNMGHGDDIVYAGNGNVTVRGGEGADLLFAGAGNANLYGKIGDDVLETNSLGVNLLVGGQGDDALIANRGGTNNLRGGDGDDLLILKEGASLVNSDGSFNFGKQIVAGGDGQDTLRFIINDQNPVAEQDFIAEFQKIEAAFDASQQTSNPGVFNVDGLRVTGIEALQLQVDSVSSDPTQPYAITHTIQLSDGAAPPTAAGLSGLLQTAQNWNLLSV